MIEEGLVGVLLAHPRFEERVQHLSERSCWSVVNAVSGQIRGLIGAFIAVIVTCGAAISSVVVWVFLQSNSSMQALTESVNHLNITISSMQAKEDYNNKRLDKLEDRAYNR